jgi:tripeptide aminopeptidase
MLTAQSFVESGRTHKDNRIIAFDTGEEGLGNLSGIRALMAAFAGQISEVIAVDADSSAAIDRGVGSIRYRMEVKTRGGHSFSAFGNPSAIAHAAHIIDHFYGIAVPEHPKTTYNAGMIEGGTSVNTIAQRCTVLLDLRSEDAACLAELNRNVLGIVEQEKSDDVAVGLELLGERPCGNITGSRLVGRVNAIRKSVGLPVKWMSGSTDCNLPLSMGIPSVCLGVYRGQGAHTMEECIDATSIPQGLQQLLALFFDED